MSIWQAAADFIAFHKLEDEVVFVGKGCKGPIIELKSREAFLRVGKGHTAKERVTCLTSSMSCLIGTVTIEHSLSTGPSVGAVEREVFL